MKAAERPPVRAVRADTRGAAVSETIGRPTSLQTQARLCSEELRLALVASALFVAMTAQVATESDGK